MQLLGESQTFIGVLATLVVLCVIAETSSNFIYNIFSSVVETTENKINDLKEHLRSIGNEIRQSDEFVKFKNEIDHIETKDSQELTKASIQALNRKVEFEISINKYTNEYSPKYFQPISKKLDEIKESREQTFGPLFILAYCVLLFVCDEICRWQPYLGDVIVGMLSFFMLISTTFVMFVWIKFMKECNPNNDQSNNPNSVSQNDMFLGVRAKRCIKQLLICLLVFLVLWLIVELCHTLFPDLSYKVYWWAFVFLCFAYFLAVGYKHHVVSLHFGKYRHSFLLIHFIMIAVLSLLFSTILSIPLGYDIRMPYEHLYLLRLTSICFILLLGIVFPFFFPYFANKNVLHFAQEWSGKGEKKAKIEGNKLKSNLTSALKEINMALSIERELILELELVGTDCDISTMKNINQVDIKY